MPEPLDEFKDHKDFSLWIELLLQQGADLSDVDSLASIDDLPY